MIARFTTLIDGRPVPIGVNPASVTLVVPNGAVEGGPTTLHMRCGHLGDAVVVEEGLGEAMRRLNGEVPEADREG